MYYVHTFFGAKKMYIHLRDVIYVLCVYIVLAPKKCIHILRDVTCVLCVCNFLVPSVFPILSRTNFSFFNKHVCVCVCVCVWKKTHYFGSLYAAGRWFMLHQQALSWTHSHVNTKHITIWSVLLSSASKCILSLAFYGYQVLSQG